MLAFVLSVGLAQAIAATGPSSEEQAERALQAAKAALHQQDWSQAELHLERSLMFVPHHAQARLELAFLLVKRGRLAAAEVLISSLIDDSRTPEDHRAKLQALLAQLFAYENTAALKPEPIAATESPRLGWQVLMDLQAGYASNPLGGSREDQIILTLESGDFALAVKPQDRHGASLALGLSALAPSGLRLGLEGQALAQPLGRQQLGLSLAKPLFKSSSGQLQFGVSAVQGFYDEQRLTTSLGWTTEHYRASARFEAGRNPSEKAAGVRLDWPWGKWATKASSLSGLAFIEAEKGVQTAPSHLRAGLLGQLQWGARTQLSTMIWQQEDTDGYSELLKNNARRRLLYAQFNVERILWQNQLDPKFQEVFLRFAYTQRWSNLPLFQYQDSQLNIGFRTGF